MNILRTVVSINKYGKIKFNRKLVEFIKNNSKQILVNSTQKQYPKYPIKDAYGNIKAVK